MTSRAIAFLCLASLSSGNVEPSTGINDSVDFPILGDYISIREKGEATDSADYLSQFINDHYIRIRLPFAADGGDVERGDVSSEGKSAGRKKPGLLVALLMALKLKLVLALLAAVGIAAAKGLWAGVLALALWKMTTDRSDGRDGDRCDDHRPYGLETAVFYYPRRRFRPPHRVAEYVADAGYGGEVWDEWDKNLIADG